MIIKTINVRTRYIIFSFYFKFLFLIKLGTNSLNFELFISCNTFIFIIERKHKLWKTWNKRHKVFRQLFISDSKWGIKGKNKFREKLFFLCDLDTNDECFDEFSKFWNKNIWNESILKKNVKICYNHLSSEIITFRCVEILKKCSYRPTFLLYLC